MSCSWLCSASLCQLPASRPAPSVQARKRGGQIEKTHNTEGLGSENISMFFSNSIANKKGFLPRPARFRGWSGAAGREAGAWQGDAIRDISGTIGSITRFSSGAVDDGICKKHSGGTNFFVTPVSTGASLYDAGSTTTNAVSGAGDVRLDFDASWSNPIYGASPTVMPASVNLPVILYLGIPA